ncbi:MerR family transcriptional regulator [Isoptericola halotolerans]|uniref:DNA-binding transcriptional MerR regulator n=1 Tax=Isoptericola halotolerans TaxID=300560 RepID=A0ABX2A3F3_9MICO|nr:MerR family transcriptional regulator [Isoptericola halotolerans]NOV97387.1 DNA-binding transcriptional MerR regulator [Isoptericola halotolerans]
MAWSTRELAELAGTTVRSVRLYHERGLLEEPDRRPNGYKQYEVRHLLSLLRIRRLSELGVPLSKIDVVREGDSSSPETLRALDAELAASIERQVKARSAIAAILSDGGPVDVPEGFEAVASRLSSADSSLVHLYGRLYTQEAMSDLRRMVESDGSTLVGDELDALPPDADDGTRQRLADQLTPEIARHLASHPWLTSPGARLSTSEGAAREMFADAVVELYNPAQLDVLQRASRAAHETLGLDPGSTPSS